MSVIAFLSVEVFLYFWISVSEVGLSIRLHVKRIVVDSVLRGKIESLQADFVS